jgi:transposase
VHNEKVQANIRCLDMHTGQLTFDEVRSFSTMTCDLEGLAAWMKEHGVTHVAMESTGVFWKPIFNVLDGRFKVLLCNAQHIKNVPGRKNGGFAASS